MTYLPCVKFVFLWSHRSTYWCCKRWQESGAEDQVSQREQFPSVSPTFPCSLCFLCIMSWCLSTREFSITISSFCQKPNCVSWRSQLEADDGSQAAVTTTNAVVRAHPPLSSCICLVLTAFLFGMSYCMIDWFYMCVYFQSPLEGSVARPGSVWGERAVEHPHC